MSYCVYLKSKQTLPAESVARLIAEIPGLSLADGQQMVRRCRGFLIEHLEASHAVRLVEKLKKLGVDADCRQIRELVANPRAVLVRSGQFAAQVCTVQDWKSQDETLSWENVFFMSVTCLEELEMPESVRKRMEPEPAPGAGLPEEVPDKKAYLLDFFMAEPPSHRRIQSTEFRYDYLGERLQRSSVANFALMLQDFDRYGSSARRDEGFKAALEQKWDEVPGYTAIYEVDEYHRWILQTLSESGSALHRRNF
jgi:hypothetical protein